MIINIQNKGFELILFFENTYDFNIITSLKNDMILELISKNNFQRFDELCKIYSNLF